MGKEEDQYQKVEDNHLLVNNKEIQVRVGLKLINKTRKINNFRKQPIDINN